jgi:2-keto-4-pentenoate hydratase
MSAASDLAKTRLSRKPIDFDPAFSPVSEDAAYALQIEANGIIAQSLGGVAGLKIGCTTPVMRAFLGINNPAAGEIFASTIHRGEASLTRADYIMPGVECEAAIRVSTDIEPSGPAPRAHDVVDAVLAAIEIVDNRYDDYKALGVNWLIADNFFNSGAVLGEPVTNWQSLDLPALEGRTMVNSAEVGHGLGASVMGHPFHALDWLIARRRASGLGISKGTICLLGSVVETKWVNAGDEVQIEIAGLGGVTLRIS